MVQQGPGARNEPGDCLSTLRHWCPSQQRGGPDRAALPGQDRMLFNIAVPNTKLFAGGEEES
jgi:hypothetical protein